MVVRQKIVGVEETPMLKKNDIPNSLTLYVIFSIAVIIIYTIVEMIISTRYQVSHDTLTTCFYSVFGGEILCCALIKIFKLKNKDELGNE